MAVRFKVKQLIADKCLKHCSVHGQEYNENRLFGFIRCQVSFTPSSQFLRKSFTVYGSCRYLSSSKGLYAFARLSPQEVTNILRENEHTQEFNFPNHSVKSYDSNQLASNNPIEDARTEARGLLTTGMLLGVFDGHGGAACAQVTAKRLFDYITVCMLPPDVLHKYLESLETDESLKLLEMYNDKIDLISDLKKTYSASFKTFVKELAESKSNCQDFQMKEVMEKALLRFDSDLSQEALQKQNGKIDIRTLSVAMSGAVACVVHVDGPHLHVANVGDCQCVLGVLSDVNTWTAKKLTTEHNTDNPLEVNRILKEHPPNERETVIKMDRLLGQLAPLRALGDFRYKWSREIMNQVVKPHFGENAVPPNYYTPPYLTACPEVVYHRLAPRDKFLVIASDGLWDLVSPLQVVRLVGEHMSGKGTLSPFRLPRNNMTLSEINTMLLQRKEGLNKKPIDTNAATHLIRNALGGTEYGLNHGKLSQLLSMPDEVVRLFRDDITVTVIYFDSEYLRHCPA